jgi:hypothetical protein
MPEDRFQNCFMRKAQWASAKSHDFGLYSSIVAAIMKYAIVPSDCSGVREGTFAMTFQVILERSHKAMLCKLLSLRHIHVCSTGP